jgi:PAS domain S-box-containing protein
MSGEVGPSQPLADRERDLHEEALALRQLLLELRADLPAEREQAHLPHRTRFAESLAALARRALEAEAMDPFLVGACTLTGEMLEVDAVALLERVPGTRRLVVRAVGGDLGGALGEVAPLDEHSQAAFALDQQGSTATPDVRAAWPRDAFLAAHEIVASAAVVLPGRDGPLGVLGAYARRRHPLGPDEVRFLEAVAGVISAAVARLRSEAALADRERQLRAVFDGAQDAMLLVAASGEVVDANAAALELFGAAGTGLVGTRVEALPISPRGDPDHPLRLDQLPEGGKVRGEAQVLRGGAAPRYVEYQAVAGVLPGRHLAVLRDVTQQQELHARLALADRMVSVGTLAAGVAHELNNPLAYVNANVTFLTEQLAQLEESLPAAVRADPSVAAQIQQLREATGDARDGVDRMRVIVRDLRTLSRADDARVAPVELAAVLDSCVNVAWNEIKQRAHLVKEYGPVPAVRGSEGRLGQVFLNLLINAAQAIPEGQPEAHQIRLVTRTHGPQHVAVEVCDTGSGIPATSIPRIFDPFFTTKPPGVGTGLGLSICHSIVAAVGGTMEVDTEVGRGTTMRVILPVGGPESGPEAPPPGPRPVRRARVLVVDDEPLVGTVIQRTLGGEHEVVVAGSARAALDRLSEGTTYDLVLTDLLMPEMTGVDLFREIERRHPALAKRVIFLTGGAFTPATREFLERAPVECVEKPFDLESIRAVIARHLDARDP